VGRDSKSYKKGEQYGNLLEDIRRRGKSPDAQNRYCTADFKRGPIMKLITRLHRECCPVVKRRLWDPPVKREQFTLINCMGMRAQESPARRKLEAWKRNDRASTNSREVYDWLPIHEWTADEVWADIRESGVRHHRAYDLGMPRLSCVFCIFANREALTLAGRHNKRLLEQYVEVERETGFTFKRDLALADVLDDVNAGTDTGPVDDWSM
jgi:3'-phosphoadenosine 5'-phosphosulfate sulfotransferase (PAPS reductase)/FAD synthetase